MRRVVLLAICVVLAVRGEAIAEGCDAEATALRAHLEREAGSAQTWTTVWAVMFGAAAAGQLGFALAEVDPLGGEFTDETRDTLYAGTVKASIGVAARVFMPLRISVPGKIGDSCAELPALRAALAEAAKQERRSFWLTHVGGTALNLAGAAVLAWRHSFKVGAISFAISYPVGPTSAYTQPRRSWRLWRERQLAWSVGASTGDGTSSLWLRGDW